MKKVIIWGGFKTFEKSFRIIEPEILKGNIQVIGLVINENTNFKFWDGIPVYRLEEMLGIEYDYIIDINVDYKDEISQIKKVLNIEEKVIPVRAFGEPGFCFDRYIKLKESNISIIAAHCWGGFAYHQLGLKFLSPFINLFLTNEDFIKLARDFKSYMSEQILYENEVSNSAGTGNYPLGRISDVHVHFEHYDEWEIAKNSWDERCNRINMNNLFFEMTCRNENEIEQFLALPYNKKIAFTDIPIKASQVIYVETDEMDYVNAAVYKGNLGWYMCDKLAGKVPRAINYNLTKLLLGEDDFMRGEV